MNSSNLRRWLYYNQISTTTRPAIERGRLPGSWSLICSISIEHSHILNGPFELCYQHLIIPEQQRQPQPVGIKEEMIKKSTMAPIWQVLGRALARSVRSSRARRRGLRGHQGKGVDCAPPSFLPHPLIYRSKCFAKISRWGDICLRGFWRTIERVLVVEPDESRSAPPYTVTLLCCDWHKRGCSRTALLWVMLFIINAAQMKSVILGLLNSNSFFFFSAHTQWSFSPREKQTNEKLNITVRSIATNRW